MKSWIDFMKREADMNGGLRTNEFGFGDWLQPIRSKNAKGDDRVGETSHSLIGTAYYIKCADIMQKVAKILSKNGDAEYFANIAKSTREKFSKKFVNENGQVEGGTQTAYLLTLANDIAPKNMRAKIFENFPETLARYNYHLNTGLIGTPLLCDVLTKFGRNDLAYRLINNEGCPSWIYPINQGATTMWERWNSYSHEKGFGSVGMNSFNHYVYGAIGQWMYGNIAGIWFDENNAGYKNILFEPKPGGGFTFASASQETPYGYALSSWKIVDGVMEWKVVIPPNSGGTLTFPSDDAKSIRIDGKSVDEGLKRGKDGRPQMQLGSGTYRILLKPSVVK